MLCSLQNGSDYESYTLSNCIVRTQVTNFDVSVILWARNLNIVCIQIVFETYSDTTLYSLV